jgi:hypothetical protein
MAVRTAPARRWTGVRVRGRPPYPTVVPTVGSEWEVQLGDASVAALMEGMPSAGQFGARVFVAFPAQEAAAGMRVTVRLVDGVEKTGLPLAHRQNAVPVILQVSPESLVLDRPGSMQTDLPGISLPGPSQDPKYRVMTAAAADPSWTEVADAREAAASPSEHPWAGEFSAGGLWTFGVPPTSDAYAGSSQGAVICETDGGDMLSGARWFLHVQGSAYDLLRISATGCVRSEAGTIVVDPSGGSVTFETLNAPVCESCSSGVTCDCPSEPAQRTFRLPLGPSLDGDGGADCPGTRGERIVLQHYQCTADADCANPFAVCRDGSCAAAESCAASPNAGSGP